MNAAIRAWAWLGTYNAARTVSVIACLYFAVSSLGVHRSYWTSFNTTAMFFGIWVLGYYSRAQQPAQQKES